MNSYEIIVTPDAEADLHEIRDYIAETPLVPDVALNYIRVIRKEMEKHVIYAKRDQLKALNKMNFYD